MKSGELDVHASAEVAGKPAWRNRTTSVAFESRESSNGDAELLGPVSSVRRSMEPPQCGDWLPPGMESAAQTHSLRLGKPSNSSVQDARFQELLRAPQERPIYYNPAGLVIGAEANQPPPVAAPVDSRAQIKLRIPCPPDDVYCFFSAEVWKERLEAWRQACCNEFPEHCVPVPSYVEVTESGRVIVIPAGTSESPYLVNQDAEAVSDLIPKETKEALSEGINEANDACPDCDVAVVMVQTLHHFGKSGGVVVSGNNVGYGIGGDLAEAVGLPGPVVILTTAAIDPLLGLFPDLLPHEAAHAGYSFDDRKKYGPLHPANEGSDATESSNQLPEPPTTPPPAPTPSEGDCVGLANLASRK